MKIRVATGADTAALSRWDTHLSKKELENAINRGHVYLAEEEGRCIGWLRYNLFWDNTPFLNLLYFFEERRGRGYGKMMMDFWEMEMRRQGYRTVMTSTQANEYAQHFYVKLGYTAVGGFLPDGEPYELIFSKSLL